MRAEEAIQNGKDIGVVGRSFEAYKSSEGAGYKPETIERVPSICRLQVIEPCRCKREISLPSLACASGRIKAEVNKTASESAPQV
jgi:hypothetical protein